MCRRYTIWRANWTQRPLPSWPTIDNLHIRKLREQLLKIQRRQRKVQQQYRALRQDNVAKLWRKAQRWKQKAKAGGKR